MKAGDYVRTKKGEIGKIIDFINEPTDYYFNCYMTTLKDFTDKYITEDSDIKSSPNIMDLIEVGDLIKVKWGKDDENIFEVIALNIEDKEIGIFQNDFDIFFVGIENIKSIVTKEHILKSVFIIKKVKRKE